MLLTALITPFLEDTSVDFASLEKLLDLQFNSRIDGLILLGTTGESATLTQTEMEQIVEFTLDFKAKSNSSKKVFVGVSDNATSRVLEKIQMFESLAIDGFLVATPFYNKPTQEGLIEHFLQISKATKKDLILYNIPGRTAVNFEPKNILKLLQQTSNIKYIKESSGNLAQIIDLIGILLQNNLDTQVLAGDDDLVLPILAIGGSGLVSVLSNLYPTETADLLINKDLGSFYKLLPTIRKLFETTNPIAVKRLLYQQNLISSSQVRLPLWRD